ncbi:MAG: PAS domain S-box protein [Syntrophales bacterium]
MMPNTLETWDEQCPSLFENAALGMFKTAPGGRLIAVNPFLARMCGYPSPDEMTAAIRDVTLHYYADPERAAELMKLLAENGFVEGFEAQIRRKDGTTPWVSIHAWVVRDRGGYVAYQVGTCEDITRRRQRDDELRQRENRLRTIVEASNAGIFVVDLQGVITYANAYMAERLGCEPDELVGKQYEAIIQGTERDAARERIKSMIRGEQGEAVATERCFLRQDGSFFWGYLSGKLLKDPDGRVQSIVGFVIDLTEIKKARYDLREQEEMFRSLVEHAPIGISVMRGDTSFEYVNPRFMEIFGYTLADLPDKKTWFDLAYSTPSFRQEVVDCWTRNQLSDQGTGRISAQTSMIRCKDGTDRVIDLYAVVTENGKFVTTYQDVTEHKKMEAHLLHAEKMEAVGTLAEGIVHDFNNILCVMQGNLSLLIQGALTDQLRNDRLAAIQRQLLTGARLTSQLLSFSRGGQNETAEVDIKDLITKNMIIFELSRKDVIIRQRHQEDLRPVMADRGQLERVLLNLCINACQAMPYGGVLSIESANADISDSRASTFHVQSGRFVRISVADTGAGMDEKTRARIFEPFFTTKARNQGTGLGLSTVYGIIKSHGGFISVYSEPGEGSTFEIYLPACGSGVEEQEGDERQGGDEEQSNPEELFAGGKETIFMVDDEEGIVHTNQELLEMMGYTVIPLCDGTQAREVFIKNRDRIDLVILDMVMPGTSGRTLVKEFRAIDPAVRIILSSGYSPNHDVVRESLNDVQGFLQKPFTHDQLARAIRSALDQDCPLAKQAGC